MTIPVELSPAGLATMVVILMFCASAVSYQLGYYMGTHPAPEKGVNDQAEHVPGPDPPDDPGQGTHQPTP